MTTVPLAGAIVVGAFLSLRGSTPFDRGGVVVEAGGTRIRPTNYTGDVASGEALDDGRWTDFLRSEQAIAISPVPAARGLAAWAVGGSFPDSEAFLTSLGTSLVHTSTAADTLVLLVDEPHVAHLRDERATRAFDDAVKLGRSADWASAVRHAELAMALGTTLSARRFALLSLCYERLDRSSRSLALRRVARNSRGAAFEAAMAVEFDLLVEITSRPAVPPVSTTLHPDRTCLRKAAMVPRKDAA